MSIRGHNLGNSQFPLSEMSIPEWKARETGRQRGREVLGERVAIFLVVTEDDARTSGRRKGRSASLSEICGEGLREG